MPELSDIVAASISEARDEGTLPPPEEPTESTDTTDTTTEPTEPQSTETTEESPIEDTTEVEQAAETTAETTETKKPTGDDDDAELTALLSEFGFKPLGANARNNRIPYKDSRRIIGTAIKRAKEKLSTQLTERDTKIATYEKQLGDFQKVDQLIAQNPDQYMRMLSALHPALYGRYLTPAEAKKEAEQVANVPDAKDDPEPQPDVKYDDGSVAYSPDQYKKYKSWERRDTLRELKGELDKELKPLREQRTQGEAQAARAQRAREEVNQCREDWGELFINEEKLAEQGKSGLMAYCQQHPTLPLKRAATIYFRDKLTADRTKIRQELIEEANKQPTKKVSAVPSPRKATVSKENQSLEDIVREQFEKAQGR